MITQRFGFSYQAEKMRKELGAKNPNLNIYEACVQAHAAILHLRGAIAQEMYGTENVNPQYLALLETVYSRAYELSRDVNDLQSYG